MPPGEAIIEGDRFAAGQQPLIAIDPAHVRGKQQVKRQQTSGGCVVRKGLSRSLEGVDLRAGGGAMLREMTNDYNRGRSPAEEPLGAGARRGDVGVDLRAGGGALC